MHLRWRPPFGSSPSFVALRTGWRRPAPWNNAVKTWQQRITEAPLPSEDRHQNDCAVRLDSKAGAAGCNGIHRVISRLLGLEFVSGESCLHVGELPIPPDDRRGSAVYALQFPRRTKSKHYHREARARRLKRQLPARFDADSPEHGSRVFHCPGAELSAKEGLQAVG